MNRRTPLLHALGLALSGLAMSACGTIDLGPFVFDGPTTAAVLHPDDGGPFEEPIGFVSNVRSGRVTPIDLKHATLLSDNEAAPWLSSRGIATGDERHLGDVVAWAPDDERVSVLAVDLTHQLLVEAPYIAGTSDGLELVAPTSTDPVYDDVDGSGDNVSVSDVGLSTGWTTTEDWTLESDGSRWYVTGSRSGLQGQPAEPGTPWRSDNRELELTVAGSGTEGDRITLSTDTGIVEHDVGTMPLVLAKVPGQSLVLVGTWDAVSETGALVVWDSDARAEVGSVPLGPESQPWEIEVAIDQDDMSTADRLLVFVGDSFEPVVHEIDLDLVNPASSTVTAIPTAGVVADVAWVAGDDHDGQPFDHLFIAPAGLNRVDLYDRLAQAWVDVNPLDDVDLAGIDLYAPVTGMASAPDPIRVQTLTDWGTRTSAHVVATTLFDGSLIMVDAATGCLVNDIEGARITTQSGEEIVEFNDVGSSSSPALQADDATGRKVVTSTCGGLMRTETWRLTFDGAAGNWEVDGTVSGPQVGRLVEDQRYVSDNGAWSILILSGPLPSTDGDEFQFSSEEGALRLDVITDASSGDVTFDNPAEPIIFQYDAGATGGGWDVLDRRTFALLPLTGNDLVLRVRLQAWQIEVVWE